MKKCTKLEDLCMEAATANRNCVEIWQRERRTPMHMPTHLAKDLFNRLLSRRLLFPPILEIFKFSIEKVDLRCEGCVDAEWMAYLGAYHYMHSLNIADCNNIDDFALSHLSGHNNLKELDLSRCAKITDAGIKHLLSIQSLEKLWVSEIGLTMDGVICLSSFANLRVLDLGGIPVTDIALSSLLVLTQLVHLDLWGSEISNIGAAKFDKFPMLSILNIAWTNVTRLPILSIGCLNMSNCTIFSIADGDSSATISLSKLIVTGATFIDADQFFLSLGCLKFLDLSYSNLSNFSFLFYLQDLEHLNLRSNEITDSLMEQVASAGENLRYLNLSYTKITSQALSILVGCMPNLEILVLSHTLVDNNSFPYISMVPSLQVIDLSHSRIIGNMIPLSEFQNLTNVRSINLEGIKFWGKAIQVLSHLTELECIYLKSDSLTDTSLHTIASLQKLKFLGYRDSVLSNDGLLSYTPPPLLCVFDLRGCWRLSAIVISSFCEKYKQVQVRHVYANKPFVDKNVYDGSTSSAAFMAQNRDII